MICDTTHVPFLCRIFEIHPVDLVVLVQLAFPKLSTLSPKSEGEKVVVDFIVEAETIAHGIVKAVGIANPSMFFVKKFNAQRADAECPVRGQMR
jgi:hypothetical protein